MSTSTAVEAERKRRARMWKAIEEIQAQRPLKSDEVRELGCYGSARGIWRDTKETKHLTPSGCGVAVGISSRGKYEDEFTDETALYRYPLTQQRGQDDGDIRSLRWALEFNLPLFLIRSANAKGELTHSGKFRKVDKVFILRDLPDPDGLDGEVLLTFSQGGKRDYSLTPEEGGSFEERQTALRTTKSKKRSQALFSRRVLERYGPKRCAVCGALPADGGGGMTTWAQDRRLELVFDKTLDTVHQRMQKVSKKDRKALRREFQGWFSNDWNDLDILWLEHYKAWEDKDQC